MYRWYKLENKNIVDSLSNEYDEKIKGYYEEIETLRSDIGFKIVTGNTNEAFWVKEDEEQPKIEKFLKLSHSEYGHKFYKMNMKFKKAKDLKNRIINVRKKYVDFSRMVVDKTESFRRALIYKNGNMYDVRTSLVFVDLKKGVLVLKVPFENESDNIEIDNFKEIKEWEFLKLKSEKKD